MKKNKEQPGPVTISRMLRELRKIERASSNGATGATIVKLSRTPLTLLIDRKKIGPVEFQAARDIETAFLAISGALIFKPLNLEKVDRSRIPDWSPKIAAAVSRYRKWAMHWSMMRDRGNPGLQIVIAAIIDEWPFSAIEEKIGLRHGLASKATVRLLRDYAARAGWAEHGTAAKWKAEAGNLFRTEHPELRIAKIAAAHR